MTRASLLVSVSVFAACGRLSFDPSAASDPDAPGPDALFESDLVAYYAMERDPATGVPSEVGGHHGMCNPTCPVLTPGIAGTGFLYDGVDDTVEVPDAAELRLDAGTFALWVRVDRDPPGGNATVFGAKVVGTARQNSWELYLKNQNPGLRLSAGGNSTIGGYVTVDWTHGLGTWAHLAMTWTPTSVELYIDGAKMGQTGLTMVYDDGPMVIGADNDDGGPVAHHAGALDEVRLYRRALTADEIAQLAAN